MLHWTWWLLTLALLGRLCRALHPKFYATRNLCMHAFLKLHHNCDAYMGLQKERKSTCLTAFEHWETETRSLFAAQYWYSSCLWMSLSSESSVSNTIPSWSTDFNHDKRLLKISHWTSKRRAKKCLSQTHNCPHVTSDVMMCQVM